jgi:AcrR family transcriptional regulator
MPGTGDPIRKQLVEARRNQILDAAAQVISERGFARATTRAIAETAGVSEGTLYNYFANKEDLLLKLVERLIHALRLDETLDEFPAEDPRGLLVSMYRYRLKIVEEHWTMLRAIMSEVMVNRELGQRYYREVVVPTAQLLEEHIQARVDRGQIRAMNVPLFVRLLLAINIGLFLGFFMGEPLLAVEGEDWIEDLAGLLFDGINPAHSGDAA